MKFYTRVRRRARAEFLNAPTYINTPDGGREHVPAHVYLVWDRPAPWADYARVVSQQEFEDDWELDPDQTELERPEGSHAR